MRRFLLAEQPNIKAEHLFARIKTLEQGILPGPWEAAAARM